MTAVRSCPDCEQGKHHNCDGRAWDNDADDFAPCPCAHTGHGDATAHRVAAETGHAAGEYCIEWVGVDLAPDGPDKVWACVECGHTRRQGDTP
jgi:hypothetical protein